MLERTVVAVASLALLAGTAVAVAVAPPGTASAAVPGRMLPLSAARQLPASWSHGKTMVPAPATSASSGPLPEPATSANWSGYIDSGAGATFTGVSARWAVPTVAAGTTGDSSTWVGIDGYGTDDLVQAGTDQSDGTYYAWYELVPQYAFELGSVRAGDKMAVEITQQVPGTWLVTVSDTTSGVTWSGPVAYYAAKVSAEWVEEAPTASSGDIETLAPFGHVRFTNMAVAGPGTSVATGQPVYLLQSSTDRVGAWPGQYNAATGSLTVNYGPRPGGVVGYPAVPITGTFPTGPGGAGGTSGGGGAGTGGGGTGGAQPTAAEGYWLASADGSVHPFGAAVGYGSPTRRLLGSPVVGIAATPDGRGYWLATADGGVFAYGDAVFRGSLPGLGYRPAGTAGPAGLHLQAPVVGIAPAAGGGGYYLVTSDGGVFAFGTAHFEGSCLSGAIDVCSDGAVAIVPDATGLGYWLLLAGGNMLPFGDAPRTGDGDCQALASQTKVLATAAARTPDGKGYWVALQNGTTCAEGDALTEGIWEADGATDRKDPVVALITDGTGKGAWMVMAGGTVDRYGDAPRLGGFAGKKLASAIVGAAGL